MALFSGFPSLDACIGGFQKSDLVVVAARPGEGRFSLALTMAVHNALEDHVPVGFFSLEVSGGSLARKLPGMESISESEKILTAGVFTDCLKVASRVHDAPLFISDEPNQELAEIAELSRLLCSRHGVKIIFIDYFDLISYEGVEPSGVDCTEVAAKTLKDLACELGIPIVVSALLKRSSRATPPTIKHLGKASILERYADVVILFDRNGQPKETVKGAMEEAARFLVVKNRNNQGTIVEIGFSEVRTR